MFNLKRKVLFGVSVSMVLAMAIGSFALGENQTPASPQAVEAQSAVGETAGAFTVIGGTQGTDYDFTGTSGTDGVLKIHPQSIGTNITISNAEVTTDRIEVTSAATITLAGVDINTGTGSPLKIQDDATFDVNILLADDSENSLVSTVSASPYGGGAAGLQKNGKGDNIGTLTIGVPDGSAGTGKLTATGGSSHGAGIGSSWYNGGSKITITGGEITANGGTNAAGIGGGRGGSGSDITISGGKVTATGGAWGAGIGGGNKGSGSSNITINGGVITATGRYDGAGIGDGDSPITIGSGNSLNGDAVVLATSGSASKAALDGFADSDLNRGITFTRQTTSGIWSGMMYGNSVKITEDVEFPADLTISANKQVTVGENKTLTIPENVTLTTESGATLKNDGTITINNTGTIDCQGTITTKTDFYLEDSSLYNTGYQTYQTNAGVQKYTNLPNPYNSNDAVFGGWFTKPGGPYGGGTKVDENTNVLLNDHNFYEYRLEEHEITIDQPEHGTITTDPENPKTGDEVIITVIPEEGYEIDGLPIVKTEDGTIIEVIPTGNPNEYKFIMPNSDVTIEVHFVLISEPEVKTGDSFAGIAALAILGLATTGAVMLRKRK